MHGFGSYEWGEFYWWPFLLAYLEAELAFLIGKKVKRISKKQCSKERSEIK